MAASFCTQCGNKMVYNFAPPNFCSKCGTKLTASISSSPAPAARAMPKRKREEEESFNEDDDEFSSSDELPDLTSLAYELENDSGNRQYQFGELFGQPKTSVRRTRAVSLDDFKEQHGKRN